MSEERLRRLPYITIRQQLAMADRLEALLKLGIPKNMTYTRSEIGAVIRELRGEE